MTARRVLAEFVVPRLPRPEKIEKHGQTQAPNAVAPPTQERPPCPPRRTWSEDMTVVYGESQQPTSALAQHLAEAVHAPIVIPPDVNKLAIEALVRAGITYGWQFGLVGLDLPKVDIVWDRDVPIFKARG